MEGEVGQGCLSFVISTEMLMERGEQIEDAKEKMQSGRKSNCRKRKRERERRRKRVDGSNY